MRGLWDSTQASANVLGQAVSLRNLKARVTGPRGERMVGRNAGEVYKWKDINKESMKVS